MAKGCSGSQGLTSERDTGRLLSSTIDRLRPRDTFDYLDHQKYHQVQGLEALIRTNLLYEQELYHRVLSNADLDP